MRAKKTEKKYSKTLLTRLFKELCDDLAASNKKINFLKIKNLKIKAYKTRKSVIRFTLIYSDNNIVKGISFGNALFNIISELEGKSIYS